jgi:hypothetical protein
MDIKLGQVMRFDGHSWEMFDRHAKENNIYPSEIAWRDESWKFWDGVYSRWLEINNAPRHAREAAAVLESRRPKTPAPKMEPPKALPVCTGDPATDSDTALVHVNQADVDLVARNRQLERQIALHTMCASIGFWSAVVVGSLVWFFT